MSTEAHEAHYISTIDAPFEAHSAQPIRPMAHIDDKVGKHTALELAARFGIGSSTLRTRWYPKLKEAVGSDQRLKRKGKFTDLAQHLFEQYSNREESMSSDEWISKVSAIFQQELQNQLPANPSAIALRTDALVASGDYYETAAEFLDAEIEDSRDRASSMLSEIRSLQVQSVEYAEVSEGQVLTAAEEHAYEQALKLELAKQKGSMRAQRDLRQPPQPKSPPSARFQ